MANGQHKTESHWCSLLPIVCLACSRSCCFVLPLSCPLSLYRPKQALDATHRHYYSYMCGSFWQRINASFFCVTLLVVCACKPVQVRLLATPVLHAAALLPFIHLARFNKEKG